MKKKDQKKNIEGIVIPVQWDDNGNVIHVSIQATNEEEYVVEGSSKGVELLPHIQKKIKATGRTRKRLDGKTVIRIEEYRIVSDYQDT